MTLLELIAWLITSNTGYAAMMQRSEHTSVRIDGQRVAAEVAMLRRVSVCLRSGAVMPPDVAIWHQWLTDILPTYRNNPHRHESANTAARLAALRRREAALHGRNAA